MANAEMTWDEDLDPAVAGPTSLEMDPTSPGFTPEVREPAISRAEQYAKLYEILRHRHALSDAQRNNLFVVLERLEQGMTESSINYFDLNSLLDPTLVTNNPERWGVYQHHPSDLFFGLYRQIRAIKPAPDGTVTLQFAKGEIAVNANKVEFIGKTEEGMPPTPFTAESAQQMVLTMLNNQRIMKSGKGVKINGSNHDRALLQRAINEVNERLPEGHKIIIANPMSNKRLAFSLGFDRHKLEDYVGNHMQPERPDFPDFNEAPVAPADLPEDNAAAMEPAAPEGVAEPAPAPAADALTDVPVETNDNALTNFTGTMQPGYTVEAAPVIDADSFKDRPFTIAPPQDNAAEPPVVTEEPPIASEPVGLDDEAAREKAEYEQEWANYLAQNFDALKEASKITDYDNGIYSYASVVPGQTPVRVYFKEDGDMIQVLDIDEDFLTEEQKADKIISDETYFDSLDREQKIMAAEPEEKALQLQSIMANIAAEIVDAEALAADRKVDDEPAADTNEGLQHKLNVDHLKLNTKRYAEFARDYVNLIAEKIHSDGTPVTMTPSGETVFKYAEEGAFPAPTFYVVAEKDSLRLIGYNINDHDYVLKGEGNKELFLDIRAEREITASQAAAAVEQASESQEEKDRVAALVDNAAANAIEKGITRPAEPAVVTPPAAVEEPPVAETVEAPATIETESVITPPAEAPPEAEAETDNDAKTYQAIKELMVTSPERFQRVATSRLLDSVNSFAHVIQPGREPLIMDNDELVARLRADNMIQTKIYAAGKKQEERIAKVASYNNFVPVYKDGKPAYEENPVYRAVVESIINDADGWNKTGRGYEDVASLVKTHRDTLQYTGSLTEAKMAADIWSHLKKDGIIAVSDAKKTASILSVASGLTHIDRFSLRNAFAIAAAKQAAPETAPAVAVATEAKSPTAQAMDKATSYDPDGDGEDLMVSAVVTAVPEELQRLEI